MFRQKLGNPKEENQDVCDNVQKLLLDVLRKHQRKGKGQSGWEKSSIMEWGETQITRADCVQAGCWSIGLYDWILCLNTISNDVLRECAL